jgi:uncharacterized GH25 family protein
MIDVAIPADRNITQKEAQKKLKYKQLVKIKYKSLSIQIQRMWNMKCMIIPVNNWSHLNSNDSFQILHDVNDLRSG